MECTIEERYEKDNKLIHYVANKYRKLASDNGLDYDDLHSACNYGFLKACKTYKEDKGVLFGTYAMRVMVNEIGCIVRKARASTRIPWYFQEAEVVMVNPTNGDSNVVPVYDKITSSIDLEEEVIEKQRVKYVVERMKEDKKLYKIYLLLDSGMTQEEVGKKLGYSQSYVSRLRTRLKKKVLKYMGEYDGKRINI